jgi:hypothetical protein
MTVGNLVRLCPVSYPRHKGKIGVLIELPKPISRPSSWAVLVGGEIHPYAVIEKDMVVVT